MEECLYTKADLAKRWQVSEKSIDKWRQEGILTTCKGVPTIRFSPEYIHKLEGMEISRFSPIARNKMEDKIEEQQQLIDEYRELNRKLKPVLYELTSKLLNL